MSSYINAILRNVLAEQERLLAEYNSQISPYNTTSLTTTYPETDNSDYTPGTSEKTDFSENAVLRNVLAEQERLLAEYNSQISPYNTTSLTTTYPEESGFDTSENSFTEKSAFNTSNNSFAEASMPDIPNNSFAEASMPDIPNNSFAKASMPDIPNNSFAKASMPDTESNMFSSPELISDIDGENKANQQQCIMTLNSHQNQFITLPDLPQQRLQDILSQTGEIPPEDTILPPLQNQK